MGLLGLSLATGARTLRDVEQRKTPTLIHHFARGPNVQICVGSGRESLFQELRSSLVPLSVTLKFMDLCNVLTLAQNLSRIVDVQLKSQVSSISVTIFALMVLQARSVDAQCTEECGCSECGCAVSCNSINCGESCSGEGCAENCSGDHCGKSCTTERCARGTLCTSLRFFSQQRSSVSECRLHRRLLWFFLCW